MRKIALIGLGAFALPLVSSAQQLTRVKSLISSIGDIIEMVIPFVFALALLGFFWGLAKYLLGGAEDKESAKNIMIWGIVVLFVMAAVWGLVRFLGESVGITPGEGPVVNPQNLIPGGKLP